MKEFKGFPLCKKHNVTYKYLKGCPKCKKEKPKSKEKPIDKALREMEGKGLMLTMCDYCQKNEAMEGHSYRFKPICHDCCNTKSPRYKKEQ